MMRIEKRNNWYMLMKINKYIIIIFIFEDKKLYFKAL